MERASTHCVRTSGLFVLPLKGSLQETQIGRVIHAHRNLALGAILAAFLFAPTAASAADVNVSGLIQFDYYSSDDNNN